ncbi:MAG: M56 family metallopeptidase, partial [Flavitalea sp.]
MTGFNQNIFRAIGWTLIHSLWQGALLALLAALIMMFTIRSKPSSRYFLLLLCFGLFPLLVCTTFIVVSKSNRAEVDNASSVLFSILPATGFNDFLGFLALKVDQFSVFIVAIWLFVCVFNFFRLCVGVRQASMLRNFHVIEMSTEWKQWFNRIVQRVLLPGSIQIMESALIRIPVVIGFLKPVILLPAGMITGMSAGQLEAIVLHELAHVIRKDYLVNILQRITESMFFFNPGIRWVSTLLREEREQCCDEFAITHGGGKVHFAESLLVFAEQMSKTDQLAVAFGGSKSQLTQRISRLVTNRNRKLGTTEKIGSILALVLCFVMLVFTIADKSRFVAAGNNKGQTFVAKQALEEETIMKIGDDNAEQLHEFKANESKLPDIERSLESTVRKPLAKSGSATDKNARSFDVWSDNNDYKTSREQILLAEEDAEQAA